MRCLDASYSCPTQISRQGDNRNKSFFDFEEVADKVRGLFSNENHYRVVVVAWGLDRTLAALEKLRVDTSRWETDLMSLLGLGFSPAS